MNFESAEQAELKQAILKRLEDRISLREVLTEFALTRRAFVEMIKDDKQFAKEIGRSEVGAEMLVEDSLFVQCLQGDVKAIETFLERRANEPNSGRVSYYDQQLELLRKVRGNTNG